MPRVGLDEAAPEVVEAVEKSGLAVSVAAEIAERPAEEQKAILNALPRDDAGKLTPEAKKEVRRIAREVRAEDQAEKKKKRDEKEAKLGAKIRALPDVKAGLILSDFEWHFKVRSEQTGMDRHAANHYVTAADAQTPEAIVERQRERMSVAADDCIHLMWCPASFNAIALKVMELQGFAYVSQFVWIKPGIGTGFWVRDRHELLLIGVKGNRTIDDRFEEQSPRLASWLRSTFHYPNADAQQTALDNIARTVNRPNYAKAYSDGASLKFTETLEQISQAPVVQDAIRKAMVSAKNEAAKMGFTPPKTPFEFDGTGRLKLKTNSDGSKIEPNLQFWDIVKRGLDKTGTPEAKDWARILREHLDEVVPSYATARAGAAKFFKAGDALEAGENFVGASQRFGIPETRKALAKMSPEERQLFQDGYISRLVQTIEKTGDRRNVVNQIMNSPAAREEMHVAIGPQRTKELEARLRVESIMDRMRGAVQGNSTTVRQLTEAGLAGGVTGGAGYGLATGDWNPKDVGLATVLGSMLSGGGRYAGAKLQAGIDQRVAKKVAEMLVSDDPKVLQKGLAIVAKQRSLMGALRTADDALARAGGNQLSGATVPQLPSVSPSRADDQPDRPRGQ